MVHSEFLFFQIIKLYKETTGEDKLQLDKLERAFYSLEEIISNYLGISLEYVFYEELGSKKTAQTLADETGAELLPLNSFEGISEEDVNNGVTYTSVMTKNIENIKKAID